MNMQIAVSSVSAAAHQKLEDGFTTYAVHVLQIFSMMEVHPFITTRV